MLLAKKTLSTIHVPVCQSHPFICCCFFGYICAMRNVVERLLRASTFCIFYCFNERAAAFTLCTDLSVWQWASQAHTRVCWEERWRLDANNTRNHAFSPPQQQLFVVEWAAVEEDIFYSKCFQHNKETLSADVYIQEWGWVSGRQKDELLTLWAVSGFSVFSVRAAYSIPSLASALFVSLWQHCFDDEKDPAGTLHMFIFLEKNKYG